MQALRGTLKYRIMGIVFGIVFWELLGWSTLVPLMPPFSKVVVAWLEIVQTGVLVESLAVSMKAMVIGFAMALVVGLAVGMLTGRYRRADQILTPYINIAMSTPMIAVVPVILLWFGMGIMSRIVVVFLFSSYIVAINTAAGIRQTEKDLIEVALSFGAKEKDLFRKVMLPSAFPFVFVGIRMALNRGIKGMVLGEMLVMAVGVGAKLMSYGAAFRLDYLFAMLLSVIGVALLLTWGLDSLRSSLFPWQRV